MVLASVRWLGVRMTSVISFLIFAVALTAILVSQDAGMYLLAVTEAVLKIKSISLLNQIHRFPVFYA